MWSLIAIFVVSITKIGYTAEVIKATLPNKLHVTSLYHQGEQKRPAVLLVHGFLQTRNYQTVNSLSNSLADDGFTVLAPTLSLGVSLRQRSLACEAIHSHTMQDDINEISFWVSWLIAKGYEQIILVGHSYGSLQSLVYASGNPDPAVKKVIATSLVDVEHVLGKEHVLNQIKSARDDMKNNKLSLNEFQISYCKKFIAPPDVFLSYAEWTRERILKSLPKIQIPVDVILGDMDKRMGSSWPKLVEETGATITMVKGANHFFNDAHEFDLLDSVQSSIEQAIVE